MYLKQVELQGFKSFAGKSTFEFHKGITCIVGPNGSGKSNISDAVRWVLGEQSARAMRSHHMQDVIFAGTQSRRPVSYASVSLLLDNADGALPIEFSQVKVTRRIFRSGESEYLLNGSACRLRDIQELFYDTGVGKEGYSLIGQGQIEKILNGRPQDRRELFDEAAGIVKFKRRKTAALKKLEAEQENLVRVNDIITELERQVGPLKHQSEKARIYLLRREELKKADLSLYALQAASSQELKAQYEENISHLNAQLDEARAAYEAGKARSEQIEAQQKAQEEKIESLRTLEKESTLRKGALEHQIELLAAQSRADALSSAHYEKRLADLEASVSERRAQREEETERRTQTLSERDALEKKHQETSEALDAVNDTIREAQSRIDEANARILSLMEEMSEAQGQYRHYDTLLKEASSRRVQLEDEAREAAAQREEKAQEASSFDASLKEARAALEDLRTQLSFEEQTLRDLTEERNGLRDAQEETRRELARLQSQLETLINMAERYEGYGQSIRCVMQRHHPGVIGVVADLLQTEKKYETAIETALGGSIQNIVTRDADAAREMIEYLKREKRGRATFLPLTDVRGRGTQSEERALGEEGVIGMADTLVRCEEAYRGIASMLLGGTLVVDTLDHAIRIERGFCHALRIVTLEGESLRPGGSMTGGAFRNSSNLLGRRREQEALESSIQRISLRQKSASERLDEITALRAQCRDRIGALKEEISQKEISENTALLDLKRLSDEDASLLARQEAIRDQIAQLDEELSHSGERHQERTSQIRRIEEERASLEEESARTAERFQEAMHTRSHLSTLAEEQMLDLRSMEQNAQFMLETIGRLGGEIDELTGEAQEIRRNREEAAKRSSGAEGEEARIRGEIDEAALQADTASGELQEALSQRESLNQSYRAFFESREEMTREIARLEKEAFRLSEGLTRLQETMHDRDTYLWEEYELTPREAIAQGSGTDESESALRRQTKEISDQIRELGHVNVNAIEEYKEVGARYELLIAQRDDIEQAAENLQKMISNIDSGMRRQFREQFALIQTEFQKVFKELFGGGHGTLELADGEDDLETGIEIIAQPPGKKLQNMMQLSGGEKALTAICLLFAIQNLKPSPFCILDEIEAALDEPNVDRFAQYLRRLSGRTQFIVITHRRGSMAAADRLYGITMQEKGVSAQVSVELAQAQLEEEKEE